MKSDIAQIRREYQKLKLDDDNLPDNPFTFFEKWFNEALNAEVRDANAMHLATADADGKPALRVVLLKDFDEKGFVFFTNYNSRKGQHLKINPHCAINFYWAELERQVQIAGRVSKVSPKHSDTYFDSRPEESRIGAIVSPQSQIIESREVLEEKFRDAKSKLSGQSLKRPPNWGGYVVVPETIEFWQGRQSRLHDRILYTRSKSGNWAQHRLAP